MADGPIGLVLAAGAGSRFGMPKALARAGDGTPWVARACDALRAGGCSGTVVVLGALAEAALHLVPADADVVVARDWARGQSASLAAGLGVAACLDPTGVVVTLVDLPDLTSDAVRRVTGDAAPDRLRRAGYAGRPGHPVLIGRDHWPALIDTMSGDSGAKHFLDAHGVDLVDCSDLGGGSDVDHRAAS